MILMPWVVRPRRRRVDGAVREVPPALASSSELWSLSSSSVPSSSSASSSSSLDDSDSDCSSTRRRFFACAKILSGSSAFFFLDDRLREEFAWLSVLRWYPEEYLPWPGLQRGIVVSQQGSGIDADTSAPSKVCAAIAMRH